MFPVFPNPLNVLKLTSLVVVCNIDIFCCSQNIDVRKIPKESWDLI